MASRKVANSIPMARSSGLDNSISFNSFIGFDSSLGFDSFIEFGRKKYALLEASPDLHKLSHSTNPFSVPPCVNATSCVAVAL